MVNCLHDKYIHIKLTVYHTLFVTTSLIGQYLLL